MTEEEFRKQLDRMFEYNKHYNTWYEKSGSSPLLDNPESWSKRLPKNVDKKIRAAKKEMARQCGKMDATGYTIEDQMFGYEIGSFILDNCNMQTYPTFAILYYRFVYAQEWDDIARAFHYERRKSVEDYARDGVTELYKRYKEKYGEDGVTDIYRRLGEDNGE